MLWLGCRERITCIVMSMLRFWIFLYSSNLDSVWQIPPPWNVARPVVRLNCRHDYSTLLFWLLFTTILNWFCVAIPNSSFCNRCTSFMRASCLLLFKLARVACDWEGQGRTRLTRREGAVWSAMAEAGGGFVTRSFERMLKEASGRKYVNLQNALKAYLGTRIHSFFLPFHLLFHTLPHASFLFIFSF